MKIIQRFILLLSLTALMIACSPTTQLRKSKTDPSVAKGQMKPFTKVFVMVNAKTPENKKIAEDKLVSQVRKAEAVPSYTYLTPADTSQKELVQRLIKDGFDGVLTMRVKAVVQTKTKYKNTGTSYESWYSYGGAYGGAYGYSYTYVPGSKSENSSANVDVSGDKDYIVETNIYSLVTKKLLWSGVTASMSANKIDPAMNGIISTVKKELKKKGLMD